MESKEERKRAKGVAKKVVKNILTFCNYAEVLEKSTVMDCEQQSIRSDFHELFTYKIKKRGLSAYDDKRFILPDGIESVPYGYCAC